MLHTSELVKAKRLPASHRVEQRVPNKMLAEYGEPTAADRRLLTDGVEALQWIAARQTGTAAIPEHSVDGRDYSETAVLRALMLATRGKASQPLRLAELVRRVVCDLLLLIQSMVPSAAVTPDGASPRPPVQLALSLAYRRAAKREAG